MTRKTLFNVPWRHCQCPDKPKWWHVPKTAHQHHIACLAAHVERKHGPDDPKGQIAKQADKLGVDPQAVHSSLRNRWMWAAISQGHRPANRPNNKDT